MAGSMRRDCGLPTLSHDCWACILCFPRSHSCWPSCRQSWDGVPGSLDLEYKGKAQTLPVFYHHGQHEIAGKVLSSDEQPWGIQTLQSHVFYRNYRLTEMILPHACVNGSSSKGDKKKGSWACCFYE